MLSHCKTFFTVDISSLFAFYLKLYFISHFMIILFIYVIFVISFTIKIIEIIHYLIALIFIHKYFIFEFKICFLLISMHIILLNEISHFYFKSIVKRICFFKICMIIILICQNLIAEFDPSKLVLFCFIRLLLAKILNYLLSILTNFEHIWRYYET